MKFIRLNYNEKSKGEIMLNADKILYLTSESNGLAILTLSDSSVISLSQTYDKVSAILEKSQTIQVGVDAESQNKKRREAEGAEYIDTL